MRRLTLVAAESFHKQYGVESINLVFPNLYGEGDHLDPIRAHALGAMTYRILQAKITHAKYFEIWGSGAPIREWLHVEDAARYIIESLSLSWTFESINIGQGKGISIMELAQLIKKSVGYRGEIVLNKGQPDGAPCKIMDSSKSVGIFAIRPAIDLPNGISRTVAWYSSQLLRDKHE